MMGVTALSGIMPWSPGRTLIILHTKAVAAPVRMVAGIND